MSVPVLSKKEQKKSLSGIKNRKKRVKNVLEEPIDSKIRTPTVDWSNISIIYDHLNRLLIKFNLLRKDKELESNSSGQEKNEHTAKDRLIKTQLVLGISSVSRGVSNGSVTSLILAGDIKPKLLVRHLLLLCSLKNIPYIYMSHLRQLTKSVLGFSSIALGFKKDSTFFSPVTTLITAAKVNPKNPIIKTSIKNVETNDNKNIEEKRKTSEKVPITFNYIYRDSNKKRIFSPDSESAMQEQDKNKSFISLTSKDETKKSEPVKFGKIISEGKAFKLHKHVVIERRINKEKINEEEHDFPVQYIETSIKKMGANPDRDKKKYKKLKKKKKL